MKLSKAQTRLLVAMTETTPSGRLILMHGIDARVYLNTDHNQKIYSATLFNLADAGMVRKDSKNSDWRATEYVLTPTTGITVLEDVVGPVSRSLRSFLRSWRTMDVSLIMTSSRCSVVLLSMGRSPITF